MRPFLYDARRRRPRCNAAAAGRRGGQRRRQFLAGGTTLTRPDEARRDAAGEAGRHQRARSRGLGRIEVGPTGPPARRAGAHGAGRGASRRAARLPGDRGIAEAGRQRSRCATWRALAATCCSGPAAVFPRRLLALATSAMPGSGCAALDGVNRQHAVLGTSEHCIATYPGDFAQALIALDATVEIDGPEGRRAASRSPSCTARPATRPHIETVLAAGRADHRLHACRPARGRGARVYLKIRDRESYAFALASAAVALDLDGDTVREARIALGGVATVPWRAREAEAALARPAAGRGQRDRAAAEAAFAQARSRTSTTPSRSSLASRRWCARCSRPADGDLT